MPARHRFVFLLLAILVLAAVSCDEAPPTAPSGAILTMNANPNVIPPSGGEATITITGVKSSGEPLNEGTEIRLATTLGVVDPVARFDRNGIATAILRSTGTPGTATVSALVPSGSGSGTGTTVQVVFGTGPAAITLQGTPASIPESGGTVQLVAVVRDARGPISGVPVTFSTEAGRLDSGGRIVYTNARGEATDRLRVTAAEAAGLTDIDVKAAMVRADGSILEDTFVVRVD